jgi:hypothetical protein
VGLNSEFVLIFLMGSSNLRGLYSPLLELYVAFLHFLGFREIFGNILDDDKS